MSIDTAAILAEQYKSNPNQLRAAVLGQGSDINPYAALRALQLQKVAERYEMMQAALAGQQAQNQPSMVEQALAPTQPPQMPQQGMPQQGMPQMPQMPQQGGGLPQMQQPQGASQGLASMPAPEGEYAGGGIVAFAEGGESDDPYGEDLTAAFAANQIAPGGVDVEDLMPSPGDPRTHADLVRMLGPSIRNIRNQEYTPYTAADRKAAITASRAALQEGAGEDPTTAYSQKLDEFDAQRKQGLDQASGFGLLAAAGDMLQPGGGGLAAGIGRAAKTYGGAMQQAVAADKAEQRALMNMKFQLADAQRKERMGLTRDAMAMAQQAQKSHEAAQVFKQKRLIAEGKLVSDAVKATRPTGGAGGAGAEPKDFNNRLAMAQYNDMRADPQYKGIPDAQLKALAYRQAADISGKIPGKTGEDLKRAAIDTERGKDINKGLKSWKNSREAAELKNNPQAYAEAEAREEARLGAVFDRGNKKSLETKNSGKVATQADIEATAKASGKTTAQVEAALIKQGYTIK